MAKGRCGLPFFVELKHRLLSLTLFYNLRDDAVIAALCRLLSAQDIDARLGRYADFAHALQNAGNDLAQHVLAAALGDDNAYARARAAGGAVDGALSDCVAHELETLQRVADLTPQAVQAQLGYDGFLPAWRNAAVDIQTAYQAHMRHVRERGYGVFASHPMFRFEGGEIVPVKYPDIVRLNDLVGYETERQAVQANTLALLEDRPAANVLLYGDAGTGKSSTVKALVNEYWRRGLRLIQVTHRDFTRIPSLVERLNDNPLKFILFIDDLSFAGHSDDFTALKAILEGSVFHISPRIAVYATSNRMHLVKERFSDRDGDDIHRNDTIEELSSLSARFGLTVSFFKPGKDQYLDIVRALTSRHDVDIDDAALAEGAERFALARGGRTPRVARQYVESLLALGE
jgi:predicted AAA+ superfamily ATPase